MMTLTVREPFMLSLIFVNALIREQRGRLNRYVINRQGDYSPRSLFTWLSPLWSFCFIQRSAGLSETTRSPGVRPVETQSDIIVRRSIQSELRSSLSGAVQESAHCSSG